MKNVNSDNVLAPAIPVEDLAKFDYESRRAEERDRMSSRLTVWSLYLTLVSAFGFASIQAGGSTGYLVGFCPFVLMCLARYTRQSEDVLYVTRHYLYHVLEKGSGVEGYEHYTRTMPRSSHGGHVKALRDTFLLTDMLATVMVLAHVVQAHLVVSLASVTLPLAFPVGFCRNPHYRFDVPLAAPLARGFHYLQEQKTEITFSEEGA